MMRDRYVHPSGLFGRFRDRFNVCSICSGQLIMGAHHCRNRECDCLCCNACFKVPEEVCRDCFLGIGHSEVKRKGLLQRNILNQVHQTKKTNNRKIYNNSSGICDTMSLAWLMSTLNKANTNRSKFYSSLSDIHKEIDPTTNKEKSRTFFKLKLSESKYLDDISSKNKLTRVSQKI